MKIETERLILRDFVESDWQTAAAYHSDPFYLRYNDDIEARPERVKELIGCYTQIEQPADWKLWHPHGRDRRDASGYRLRVEPRTLE